MQYIVYKTTNLINGKIYIGQHSGEKLKPHYLGSGLEITRAINKYGTENFKRETIYYCASKEIMDKLEIETIKRYKESGKYEMYNIAPGGEGGNGYKNWSDDKKIEYSQKQSIAQTGNSYAKGSIRTETQRKAISERMKGENHWCFGKNFSGRTGKKNSLISKLKQRITYAKKRIQKNNYTYKNYPHTHESDIQLIASFESQLV